MNSVDFGTGSRFFSWWFDAPSVRLITRELGVLMEEFGRLINTSSIKT
jgi:hypothetical protein